MLPMWSAVLLFFVWGAGALSFYGIAVAHMADRAEPGKARAIGGGLAVRVGGGLGDRPDRAWARWSIFAASPACSGSPALRPSFVALRCSGAAARARRPLKHKEEFAPQLGTSVAAGEIAYGEDEPAEFARKRDCSLHTRALTEVLGSAISRLGARPSIAR